MTEPTDELYTAAQLLVSQGDPAAAVALLQAHVDAVPQDALAWRRLAALQVAAGNRAAALMTASRAIELAPDRAGGYLLRAGISLLEKRFRLVVVDAERALALTPGDPDALVALANGVAFADHDVARARTLLRQARAAAPDHAGALRLGRVLRTGRRRGLIIATGPGALAGFLVVIGGVFLLEPPAPQLFWLLAAAAFFFVAVVVASVVARLRSPLVLAGPGALAACVVGAAVLGGGAGWPASGSLRAAAGIELAIALAGAVLSIGNVQLWRRRRPQAQPSVV